MFYRFKRTLKAKLRQKHLEQAAPWILLLVSFVCELRILFEDGLAAAGGQQDIATSSICLFAGNKFPLAYTLQVT